MFEIRPDRQIPQGRKKLHAERAKYFELIRSGYEFQEAAKIVGVNYRTTKRWRSGDKRGQQTKKKAGTAAPLQARPYRPSLSSRFLSEQDRLFIADRLLARWSVRRIAQELNRAPSRISREVHRNAHPGSGAYRPYAAQIRSENRRSRPKAGKIAANAELRAWIQERLNLRWSLEQITRSLRRAFPERPEMNVVHETIYLALYVQGQGRAKP